MEGVGGTGGGGPGTRDRGSGIRDVAAVITAVTRYAAPSRSRFGWGAGRRRIRRGWRGEPVGAEARDAPSRSRFGGTCPPRTVGYTPRVAATLATNLLYFGDNLTWLREQGRFPDESVDLVYLDPPFNSNRNYNVLFKESDVRESEAQIHAFEDTWSWDREGRVQEVFDDFWMTAPEKPKQMLKSMILALGHNDVTAYLTMMAPSPPIAPAFRRAGTRRRQSRRPRAPGQRHLLSYFPNPLPEPTPSRL